MFLIVSALLMVAGIFVVNQYTAPLIEQGQIQRENALYFDIIPEATGFGQFTPLGLPPSTVNSMVTMTQGGEDFVLVYNTTFKGWNDGIEVLFFVYANRTDVAGIRIINHNETADYGGRLLNSSLFVSQFTNLSFNQVKDPGIDRAAGATATRNAVNNALQEILTYHQEVILGIETVDTTPPAVRVLALPTTFNEGAEEPNWRQYFEVTNKDSVDVSIDRGNLNMDTASVVPYVITATFVDEFGNTTVVTLDVTILPSDEAVEITIIPPRDEIIALLLTHRPNGSFADITDQFVLPPVVERVYTTELADQLVDIAYELRFTGWNPNVHVFVVVDQAHRSFSHIYILSDDETRGYGKDLLADNAFVKVFIQQSLAQLDPTEWDSFTGATRTRDAFVNALIEVLEFDATLNPSSPS